MKISNTAIIIGIILLIIIFVIAYLWKKQTKKIDVIKETPSFLFIGDSYTAGDNSYADQIAKDTPNVKIIKIAEVGKTTDWMLENASDAIKDGKYSAVFILGGINDIYAKNSITGTMQNLDAMYRMAKDSGAKVIGITVNPTDYYDKYDEQKGQLTEQLNQWIKDNGVADYVIDFNSMLKGSDGKQDTSLFEPDNLHATTYAHGLLAKEIEDKVFK